MYRRYSLTFISNKNFSFVALQSLYMLEQTFIQIKFSYAVGNFCSDKLSFFAGKKFDLRVYILVTSVSKHYFIL